ncbi:MAG: hypothetical protein A3F11_06120 [Gammaproteobacteria bacterium RIFCSPHIGHO2_12_FULL_37_14]|nr:MAG: hypothetical protein A3F11_06120 [Gammaproteobacteria bacterium RIFCSPHIGHO2_12_FULL_37_14]
MPSHSNPTPIKGNLNAPGILIAQQLDGVKAGKVVKQCRNELDPLGSCLYGTSVFAHFDHGKQTEKTKDTDDKIVIGYTCDGLPFQIVVDGFYGGETKKTFEFIDKHVTPLMDNYAEKLSKNNDPEETIKDLIRTIYTLRATHSTGSEFTMSIAITYQKDSRLYCAGFGIGDTGLILQKSSGETQQLAYTTHVNRFKDAFDQITTDIDSTSLYWPWPVLSSSSKRNTQKYV